jgi:hypothetical protein
LCLTIQEPGISVIVAPSHANKTEKTSGNGISSRWILITGKTRRKASVPGDNEIQITGNCIVRGVLNIVNETGNYNENET